MGYHMKTTADVPEELPIAAQKRAAEERLTLATGPSNFRPADRARCV